LSKPVVGEDFKVSEELANKLEQRFDDLWSCHGNFSKKRREARKKLAKRRGLSLSLRLDDDRIWLLQHAGAIFQILEAEPSKDKKVEFDVASLATPTCIGKLT
jgi:hypothetical protein